MLGLLVSWNFRRLGRRPRYVFLALAVAFVAIWLRSFLSFFPGTLGVLLFLAMAMGFVAPAAGSVAAEGRYLLTRPTTRTACLGAWIILAIALMAAAVLALALAGYGRWSGREIMIMDADSDSLLVARGFVAEVINKDKPDLHKFVLPGYPSLLNTLFTLSALMGVFARLGEVETGTRTTRSRKFGYSLFAKSPPLVLLIVWALLAINKRATYAVVLGLLHPAFLVTLFAVATMASAGLVWRTWSRGDIQ